MRPRCAPARRPALRSCDAKAKGYLECFMNAFRHNTRRRSFFVGFCAHSFYGTAGLLLISFALFSDLFLPAQQCPSHRNISTLLSQSHFSYSHSLHQLFDFVFILVKRIKVCGNKLIKKSLICCLHSSKSSISLLFGAVPACLKQQSGEHITILLYPKNSLQQIFRIRRILLPILSCPILPCPILSCPILSCPILPHPRPATLILPRRRRK